MLAWPRPDFTCQSLNLDQNNSPEKQPSHRCRTSFHFHDASQAVMRTLLPSRFFRAGCDAVSRPSTARLGSATITATSPCDPAACAQQCRCFAHVKETEWIFPDIWFTSSAPRYTGPAPEKDYKPPDERTLQLGRTVRTLHERLPTLLLSAAPV